MIHHPRCTLAIVLTISSQQPELMRDIAIRPYSAPTVGSREHSGGTGVE
jgi:hypothetical protein